MCRDEHEGLFSFFPSFSDKGDKQNSKAVMKMVHCGFNLLIFNSNETD